MLLNSGFYFNIFSCVSNIACLAQFLDSENVRLCNFLEIISAFARLRIFLLISFIKFCHTRFGVKEKLQTKDFIPEQRRCKDGWSDQFSCRRGALRTLLFFLWTFLLASSVVVVSMTLHCYNDVALFQCYCIVLYCCIVFTNVAL